MEELALGSRELEIMSVLWEHGSGTVSEVRERLADDLAYTTVLTILRNLEEKSYVSRVIEGRAHRYIPRIDKRAARQSALTRLIDTLFHGAPEQLIAHMVDDRTLTARDLRRLRELIETRTASGSSR